MKLQAMSSCLVTRSNLGFVRQSGNMKKSDTLQSDKMGLTAFCGIYQVEGREKSRRYSWLLICNF